MFNNYPDPSIIVAAIPGTSTFLFRVIFQYLVMGYPLPNINSDTGSCHDELGEPPYCPQVYIEPLLPSLPKEMHTLFQLIGNSNNLLVNNSETHVTKRQELIDHGRHCAPVIFTHVVLESMLSYISEIHKCHIVKIVIDNDETLSLIKKMYLRKRAVTSIDPENKELTHIFLDFNKISEINPVSESKNQTVILSSKFYAGDIDYVINRIECVMAIHNHIIPRPNLDHVRNYLSDYLAINKAIYNF